MPEFGQWDISPSSGEIEQQSSVKVEVTFVAKDAKVYAQKLAIDVSHRNPREAILDSQYEVLAESCVPGINTENYDSIFEEQIVVPSLNSGNDMLEMVNSNVFSVEEKTFYFGTLIPSKHPDGIIEKIKITNNKKIPCEIHFSVEKRSHSGTEEFAFSVMPE